MEEYSIKALPVKNWLIKELTPMGWAMLATQALPELLEENPNFKIMYVNKRTTWSQREIDVLNFYLKKYHSFKIDPNVIYENTELNVDYFSLVGLDRFKSLFKTGKNLFRFSA